MSSPAVSAIPSSQFPRGIPRGMTAPGMDPTVDMGDTIMTQLIQPPDAGQLKPSTDTCPTTRIFNENVHSGPLAYTRDGQIIDPNQVNLVYTIPSEFIPPPTSIVQRVENQFAGRRRNFTFAVTEPDDPVFSHGDDTRSAAVGGSMNPGVATAMQLATITLGGHVRYPTSATGNDDFDVAIMGGNLTTAGVVGETCALGETHPNMDIDAPIMSDNRTGNVYQRAQVPVEVVLNSLVHHGMDSQQLSARIDAEMAQDLIRLEKAQEDHVLNGMAPPGVEKMVPVAGSFGERYSTLQAEQQPRVGAMYYDDVNAPMPEGYFDNNLYALHTVQEDLRGDVPEVPLQVLQAGRSTEVVTAAVEEKWDITGQGLTGQVDHSTQQQRVESSTYPANPLDRSRALHVQELGSQLPYQIPDRNTEFDGLMTLS
ncbi:MAG: hypothetical protein AAFO91_00495 [Bacteroidota bacterium]